MILRTPSLRFTILLGAVLVLAAGCCSSRCAKQEGAPGLRAREVITVTDDFVVEVYQNGVRVPDSKRQLLLDRFGATLESTRIEVRTGDWLVFHLVNNRLRWGGAYYFGAAGVLAPGECGFVSELTSGAWSSCDNPALAGRFIAEKRFMSDNRPVPVERPWSEGTEIMKRSVGDSWDGEPIWGRERSCWLKVIVR
jgi:hypothetical protein